MPRLAALDPDTAGADLAPLYDKVRAMFGGPVPNLMRTFANSPAVLNAWVGLATALSGTFTPQLRQQIAVAVAQANHCEYCLSANTAAGRAVGVSDADLDAARGGNASDPKANALVEFAAAVVTLRGELTDSHVTAARAHGATDGDLAEVIALIAMNTFMNYTNSVALTDNDWPVLGIDRVSTAAG